MDFEKIYDKQVKEKFSSDYEFSRWFKDDQARLGYEQTKKALERVILSQNLSFSDYLELGPGPGTWTKLFLNQRPEAKFTLVDISNVMLLLSRQNLSAYKNVDFVRADFMNFPGKNQFDFFFSSRAFEYLPEKSLAAQKIFNFLKPGGSGVLVTKNPRYFFYKLKGRKVPQIHKGQISASELNDLLSKTGFEVFGPFCVTTTVPFFKNLFLDKMVGKILAGRKLGLVGRLLSESYCYKFTRK